jgi:hypothetical protein
MDDSFAFRTTVPLRRRFDPTMVRLAVFLTLVVTGVGLFSSWVVASEWNSFSRTSRREVPTESEVAPTESLTGSSTEAAAEEATEIALGAARVAFSAHRSFLDAGPAQLSVLEPAYTFVDGPSTTPEIVSVAATTDVWAAAVQVPGGMCLWIRATGSGDVTHGFGSDCTGSAALSPPPPR